MCKLVEDYANKKAAEAVKEMEAKARTMQCETARKAFAMGLPIESVA